MSAESIESLYPESWRLSLEAADFFKNKPEQAVIRENKILVHCGPW